MDLVNLLKSIFEDTLNSSDGISCIRYDDDTPVTVLSGGVYGIYPGTILFKEINGEFKLVAIIQYG